MAAQATAQDAALSPAAAISQEQVVQEIQIWGGWVTREDNAPEGPVVGVGFNFSPYLDTNLVALDAVLEHLKTLSKLRSLQLYNMKTPDTELRHLRRLTQLLDLDLRSPEVTDAGLQQIEGLTSLHTLHLKCPKVTDAGLTHLHGLTQLQELELESANVTDQGVQRLQQALPKCKIVH